jgi:acid stress-induced BolA-like protein IbaG/YrbA
MVYAGLNDLLASGELHAVQIHAKTPQEHEHMVDRGF